MKKSASVFNLLIAAAIFPLFFGCRKNVSENQAESLLSTGKQGSTLTTLGVTPDVYVSGSLGGQAVYWKNGGAVILPGGEMATGIAVVGPDVYVSGWGHDPSTFVFVAKYWKNGVLTDLSNGTSDFLATGIAVSGTDVYVSGTAGAWVHTALYWKNGVAVPLGPGQAWGIAVAANGDVYLSSQDSYVGGPRYWKNGSLLPLPGTASSTVNAIAVQGSNWYAVGVDDNGSSQTALCWQNGSPYYLMQHLNSDAMAVAVDPNGLPVISGTTGAGYKQNISYWLHQDITFISTGKFGYITTGVAVDGTTGDVYICGSESDSPSTSINAKYWKNGQVVVLSTTGGTASGIALGQ